MATLEISSGFEVVDGKKDLNRIRGRLTLPPEFDTDRYVGKWAKKGVGVAKARERETILGTNLSADPWTPWKDSKGRNCTRTLSDGVYVLMVRPVGLQRNVQKLYGNVSRMRLISEAEGKTVAGEERLDPGMLSTNVLQRVESEAEPVVEGLALNKIEPETTASASRASSRATPKRK